MVILFSRVNRKYFKATAIFAIICIANSFSVVLYLSYFY
ncbi:hypothetical protein A2U01_0069475, partial [Trifolium medium]|nr:hypothetical protein [Trifolium medium]